MCNTADKISSISGAITAAIVEHTQKASEAMKTLELMSITPEKYREASESLAHHTYANAYLARVQEIVETGDIKKIENVIRFHYYQLREKGDIDNADEISKAQLEIAGLLDCLVIRFFDD